jgi:hemerythrin-like metal-binding protein
VVKVNKITFKNMICVEWIDKFNIGIHEIDEQHKRLIAIMNKICDALNRGSERQIAGEVLKEMQDYASDHFALEEKYFDEFGYEKAEGHKDWHREFTRKVQALMDDLQKGKKSVSVDAISFLGGWFIDHTQTLDRQYVDLFREHGVN